MISSIRTVQSAAKQGSRYVSAQCANEKPVVLITGANTGIGFQTSQELSKKGFKVIMACRDEQKAKNAQNKIMEVVPDAEIELLQLDLNDLNSVSDASKSILDRYSKLDVLINNAGIMAPPLMRTKQGFESQFGVNHLGHFAFTLDLLPLLTTPETSSRIITVASSAHSFGQIDLKDPNYLGRVYNSWAAYGQSKLANVMFAYQLSRKLPRTANCTSNTLHPGVVATELGRYLLPESTPKFISNVLSRLFTSSPFILSVPEGAETSIYLASSPEVEGTTSKYYVKCKPEKTITPSYDLAVQEGLWNLSLELTEREDIDWESIGKQSAIAVEA